MDKETELTGGRVTKGVVRCGNTVYRPLCGNSPFVHEVLTFLESINITSVPYFRGHNSGREMLTFIEGTCPGDLGYFTTAQCCRAAEIIRALHDCLKGFPGCPNGMTVCHNDLSPCNFIFKDETPVAVIDWDASAFGNPFDDLAYAVWMWLDIGNEDNSFTDVHKRLKSMLGAYGACPEGFGARILKQMDRVGRSVFPTPEQTEATHRWTEECGIWFEKYLKEFPLR